MTTAIARVHSLHLMNCRTAHKRPSTLRPSHLLGCESACSAAIVYKHHRHLLLLLSPKADTHLSSHV